MLSVLTCFCRCCPEFVCLISFHEFADLSLSILVSVLTASNWCFSIMKGISYGHLGLLHFAYWWSPYGNEVQFLWNKLVNIFLRMSISIELMCSNTINACLTLLSNVMSIDGISTKIVSFEDINY